MEDRTETEHPAADDAPGAEKEPGKVSRILRTLGPGIVTGAADDDPSGIATYAQAGAKYGPALL